MDPRHFSRTLDNSPSTLDILPSTLDPRPKPKLLQITDIFSKVVHFRLLHCNLIWSESINNWNDDPDNDFWRQTRKIQLTLIEYSTSAFIKLVKSFLTSHQLNYNENKVLRVEGWRGKCRLWSTLIAWLGQCFGRKIISRSCFNF